MKMNVTGGERGLRIGMNQFDYHVIRTARDGVDELDRVRRENGVSQMKISLDADTPDVGQQYARMYGRGDVMLSKYLRFLRAMGYELIMVKKQEE